jgi:hypothetical protein
MRSETDDAVKSGALLFCPHFDPVSSRNPYRIRLDFGISTVVNGRANRSYSTCQLPIQEFHSVSKRSGRPRHCQAKLAPQPQVRK